MLRLGHITAPVDVDAVGGGVLLVAVAVLVGGSRRAWEGRVLVVGVEGLGEVKAVGLLAGEESLEGFLKQGRRVSRVSLWSLVYKAIWLRG